MKIFKISATTEVSNVLRIPRDEDSSLKSQFLELLPMLSESRNNNVKERLEAIILKVSDSNLKDKMRFFIDSYLREMELYHNYEQDIVNIEREIKLVHERWKVIKSFFESGKSFDEVYAFVSRLDSNWSDIKNLFDAVKAFVHDDVERVHALEKSLLGKFKDKLSSINREILNTVTQDKESFPLVSNLIGSLLKKTSRLISYLGGLAIEKRYPRGQRPQARPVHDIVPPSNLSFSWYFLHKLSEKQ